MGAFGLAACGGDDGGGDAPSRGEFARDAEKICADVQKATQQLGTPDSIGEIEKLASDTEAQVRMAVTRLDALEVPEGEDGEKAERFVAAVKKDSEAINSALADLRKAAKARDNQGIVDAAERIQGLEAESKDTDRLAREAGVAGCAS